MPRRLVALSAIGFVLMANMLVMSTASHAETRVALVIGNSAYQHMGALKNPKNDADAIARKFAGFGVEVVKGVDLTAQGMREVMLTFREKLKRADVGILFYSGHGLAVGGTNYLIPVDAQMTSVSDLDLMAVPLPQLQALMEQRPRTNLLFFDACRKDPFSGKLAESLGRRSLSVARGWAPVKTPAGTYIAFATSPGNDADDGAGSHSPFTKALLRHIGEEGRDVQLMMRRVRQDVIDETNGGQVPWERSSLVANFSFAASGADRASRWFTADRKRYRRTEKLKLFITPPMDCRLTILNVDKAGKSCLLFPHPKLADTIFKAGVRTVFPPRGALRLNEPGEETFVAMCNASDMAKRAAARDTRSIDCSTGGSDRTFNDKVFETVTFDLEDDAGKPSVKQKALPTVLQSSITVQVAAD